MSKRRKKYIVLRIVHTKLVKEIIISINKPF